MEETHSVQPILADNKLLDLFFYDIERGHKIAAPHTLKLIVVSECCVHRLSSCATCHLIGVLLEYCSHQLRPDRGHAQERSRSTEVMLNNRGAAGEPPFWEELRIYLWPEDPPGGYDTHC